MAAPKSKQPFEDLYRQLEETVTRLEQGGLSLDDSLAAYEEAVAIAQRCQQLLERAELRITELKDVFARSTAQAGAPGAGEDEPDDD